MEGKGHKVKHGNFWLITREKKGYHEGSQTLKTGDHSGGKISCMEGIQNWTQWGLEEPALSGPTLSRD